MVTRIELGPHKQVIVNEAITRQNLEMKLVKIIQDGDSNYGRVVQENGLQWSMVSQTGNNNSTVSSRLILLKRWF
jgi:hypothetical protein